MGVLLTAGEAMLTVAALRVGPLASGAPASLGVAGSEATVAIGAARLGHDAVWLSRLGDDEPGDAVLRAVRSEGVRTLVVRDTDLPTGLMLSSRRVAGSRGVQYYRAGSAASALSPEDAADAPLSGVDLVHLSGITPALSASARAFAYALLERARAAGAEVSIDLNHRRRLWSDAEATPVLRDLAARADIVFASDDEARLVLDAPAADEGALAEGLRDLGPRVAVVTAGARGAWYHDGRPGRQRAVEVEEVDPFGAGDAFVAGFLAGRLDGLPSDECAARAAQVAAVGVATTGDADGLPTRRELDALLRGESIRR